MGTNSRRPDACIVVLILVQATGQPNSSRLQTAQHTIQQHNGKPLCLRKHYSICYSQHCITVRS